MSINILMPALSPTMEKGNLARWLVKEGDKVSAGDVIAEIETDKAIMEFESIEDGIVGKILVPEGTNDVAVNTPIAILLESGETLKNIDSANQKKSSLQSANKLNDQSFHNISKSVFPGVSLVNNSLMITSDSIVSESQWTGAMRSLSVREALCEAMAEEMRRDPDVFIMGEEVAEYQGSYKVTKGLLQEFGPKRVIDTPITEHGFTGLGCGAAFFGLKPIIEFMTFNFSMQAIDHIINTAGKTLYMSGGQVNVPIVFRGPNGAASRVAAQHSQCYASWYAHCPGLKVVSPYSASDAKGLLKSAIRDLNPVIFLENELLYGNIDDVPDSKDWIVPLGKAKIVRSGTDITIVTFSIMVGRCIKAAQYLFKEGIDVEIIDLRTLRPLDWHSIIRSLKKTNRLIIAEEGWPYAGIGSAISALIAEHAIDLLDAPILRVAGKDVLLPYASNLESLALPQVEDVVHAVQYVCYKES